ncbi:MAG: hypothetical protein MK078_15220 [Crocinitomicaceae bacterium]|nr:hypothetical protein [Crocinitomicaceae bacterium]
MILTIISGILFAPIFNGYLYIITWLYQLFGLVLLGGLYSLFSKNLKEMTYKILTSVLLSGFLLILLGWFSFMDSFGGNQKVLQTWETDNYKIEYIKDQGFAGGPLMKYELSVYSSIPIFIKKIETARKDEMEDKCIVIFPESELIFNKCENQINHRK